jgi:hypothetical protein
MSRKSGRAALALALEQRKTLEELAASRTAPAREVELARAWQARSMPPASAAQRSPSLPPMALGRELDQQA